MCVGNALDVRANHSPRRSTWRGLSRVTRRTHQTYCVPYATPCSVQYVNDATETAQTAHTVRVPAQLWADARIRAMRHGETVSHVVRRALEAYTAPEEGA